MNQRDLESWSIRAAQELQDMVDDMEEAVASEERETTGLSAKALLVEFDAIFNGHPLWQTKLENREDRIEPDCELDL